MLLLTAVNNILPKLGEHPVTNLTVQSPTLSVILPEIETQRKDLLTTGYWFNRFSTTLMRDNANEITLPLNTLAFKADTERAVVRGTRLYNGDTLSFTWGAAVAGTVILDVPFEELPESVAQLITYTAATTAYATDIGLEPVLQLWQQLAQAAALRVQKEHLRNMQYTTQRSPRYARLRDALRA